MSINENFYAYLAKEVGDNKSIIERFTMLLEKLYNKSWHALAEEDMKDYDFASDIESLSEENDCYYYAYWNFIEVLRSEQHLNDPSNTLNEFAAEYWRQQRVARIEKLLLDCTELRDLFHPTEDYPTYESMLSASTDWALDNHDAEEWSFGESAINEMLYYKMHSLVGVPNETLHPIYEKLIESIK